MNFTLRIILALALPLSLLAATNSPPPGGTTYVSEQNLDDLVLIGKTEGVSHGVVQVEHPEFSRALEVDVPVARHRPWDTQLELKNLPAIREGDVLYVSFWLRGLRSLNETGEVRLGVVLEEPGTFTKSLEQDFSAGRQWRHYQYPILARAHNASTTLNLRVGGRSQRLQLAGLQVVNYGRAVAVDSLPATRFTYQGREADAPWRQAAAARIEQHRKGDLVLKVVDAGGQPISGATVKVEMQRHAFHWGTAVSDDLILDPSPEAENYRRILVENFNYAVPENLLKWGVFERRREHAIKTVDTLLDLGLAVRSHCMIWASWQGYLNGQGWAFLPRKAFDLRDDPEALRQLCYERIADIGGVFRGKVESIDVLNEPMEHHDVMRLLGEDEIAEWFKRARQADPDAALVLNEAITFEWSAGAQNLVRLARRLDELGAPLDAIGIQAHYGVSLTGIDDVYAALNRFAETGKKVQITEFDLPGHDQQLQADYLRDFATLVFSHPAVTHFVQWGVSDAHHWRAAEKAGLWDAAYRIKPAGEAYRDLVFRQFWTSTEGLTDAGGAFSARGFSGAYKITVKHEGHAKEIMLDLPVGGTTNTVRLP